MGRAGRACRELIDRPIDPSAGSLVKGGRDSPGRHTPAGRARDEGAEPDSRLAPRLEARAGAAGRGEEALPRQGRAQRARKRACPGTPAVRLTGIGGHLEAAGDPAWILPGYGRAGLSWRWGEGSWQWVGGGESGEGSPLGGACPPWS